MISKLTVLFCTNWNWWRCCTFTALWTCRQPNVIQNIWIQVIQPIAFRVCNTSTTSMNRERQKENGKINKECVISKLQSEEGKNLVITCDALRLRMCHSNTVHNERYSHLNDLASTILTAHQSRQFQLHGNRLVGMVHLHTMISIKPIKNETKISRKKNESK